MVDGNWNKIPVKALETCRQTLSYISIFPVDKNTRKWKRVLIKGFPFITIPGNLLALIASVLYFLRFVSTDLEKCLYAIYQIAGMVGFANSIIVTLITHHKLQTIFENLNKIYRASK